jgi:hypothetical protein
MKTTLNVILLILAAILPTATFAGLVGILPPTVFVGSEAALFAFASVGLMLIGLSDTGGVRRPVLVHCPPMTARIPLIASPSRRRSSYGIRRHACPVA